MGSPPWGYGYPYPATEIYLTDEETEELARRARVAGLGGIASGASSVAANLKAKSAAITGKLPGGSILPDTLFGYPRNTVLLLGGGVIGVAAFLIWKKKQKKAGGV
jgi:hypothetical protein